MKKTFHLQGVEPETSDQLSKGANADRLINHKRMMTDKPVF
jgi:hypothetical protein